MEVVGINIFINILAVTALFPCYIADTAVKLYNVGKQLLQLCNII